MNNPIGKLLSEGNDWAYDRYFMTVRREKLWRGMAMTQAVALIMAVGAVGYLATQQKVIPIPIRINELTHSVNVEQPLGAVGIADKKVIESLIVNYVQDRETYHFYDLKRLYKKVMIQTDRVIGAEYQAQQSPKSEGSFFKQYGESGMRNVRVHDVIFIEQEKAESEKRFLAKVDFTSIVTSNGKTEETPWIATILCEFQDLPNDPEIAWQNPLGFVVKSYHVTKRMN